MQITVPTVEKFQTRSLNIFVRANGILVMKFRDDWDQPDTLDTARENSAALIRAVNNQPRVLLLHTPPIHQSKEVLEYYQQQRPGLLACALVVPSFGAKVVGNLYLRITAGRTTEPTKLFTKEAEAERWLLSHLPVFQRAY